MEWRDVRSLALIATSNPSAGYIEPPSSLREAPVSPYIAPGLLYCHCCVGDISVSKSRPILFTRLTKRPMRRAHQGHDTALDKGDEAKI